MEFKLDTTAKVVGITATLSSIIMSVIYLIIWLVQLNVGFVANTTLIKEISTKTAKQEEAHIQITRSLERTNWILDSLEKRQAVVEEYIKHDDEAVEKVERKTDLLEKDIRNHIDAHDWSFE